MPYFQQRQNNIIKTRRRRFHWPDQTFLKGEGHHGSQWPLASSGLSGWHTWAQEWAQVKDLHSGTCFIPSTRLLDTHRHKWPYCVVNHPHWPYNLTGTLSWYWWRCVLYGWIRHWLTVYTGYVFIFVLVFALIYEPLHYSTKLKSTRALKTPRHDLGVLLTAPLRQTGLCFPSCWLMSSARKQAAAKMSTSNRALTKDARCALHSDVYPSFPIFSLATELMYLGKPLEGSASSWH